MQLNKIHIEKASRVLLTVVLREVDQPTHSLLRSAYSHKEC